MAVPIILNHPLINTMIAEMRDKHTDSARFRELIRNITILITNEATADLPTKKIICKTPLEKCEQFIIDGKNIVICPILRAGLGMTDGILSFIPNAAIHHIGIFRNEQTHKPIEYYNKIKGTLENKIAIIIDPMLATGGSVIAAIDILKKYKCKNIRLMSIISAPEGISAVTAAHPDVQIYAAAQDRCLNEKKYILPGLGDAGDRIFNT